MSAKTEILSILAKNIVRKASLYSTCGSLHFSSLKYAIDAVSQTSMYFECQHTRIFHICSPHYIPRSLVLSCRRIFWRRSCFLIIWIYGEENQRAQVCTRFSRNYILRAQWVCWAVLQLRKILYARSGSQCRVILTHDGPNFFERAISWISKRWRLVFVVKSTVKQL